MRLPRGPGLSIGLAGLAKVTPMLALPLLWRKRGRRPGVLAAVFAAGYSVVAIGGAAGSLPLYLASYADNDSLHALVREAAALAGVSGAARLAKAAPLAALAASIAALLWLPRARATHCRWPGTHPSEGVAFTVMMALPKGRSATRK